MATLNTAQTNTLQYLVDYLRGAPNLPLDSRVVDQLDRVFTNSCGFKCACSIAGPTLRDSLRDQPIRTLLQLILCTSTSAEVPGTPGSTPAGVCPTVVNLGTAAAYAVLSSTPDVSNTGASTISGSVGVSPAASVVGFPPGVVINGSVNAANTASANARADLTAAFIALAALPGGVSLIGDIGGQTITPGIYKSTNTLSVDSADVVFDGLGDPCATFLFQTESTFGMTAGRKIILVNGANAKNIFFKVGSSATLGANTVFKGTILALTSITAVTGASITGRLLARNGEVTLDTNAVVIPF